MVAATITARAASADPACEAAYLNLEEGASWTYERAVPEGDDAAEQAQGGDIVLEYPTELVIEVLSITTEDDETVVQLGERYGDLEQTTTARCDDEQIVVSPQSFLAAGEPGGGVGVTLEETDRDGASYPRALRPGLRWNEWIEAEFQHAAAEGTEAVHPAGKIQVERTLQVIRRVQLMIGEQSFRPFRVDYTLAGRAMVEPEIELGVEIPADAAGAMWFEPGVGLIRAVNRFGHDWTLVLPADDD